MRVTVDVAVEENKFRESSADVSGDLTFLQTPFL